MIKSEYMPKYHIFIISKGRWESRLTSRSLEEMQVPYKIVVEDSEYDNYASVIDPDKVIALPTDFRENPNWAIPDKDGRIGGSIPVRNWVWDYSIENGFEKSWVLDDNIRHFYRLNRNYKTKVKSPAIFKACEDFTDRYENVKLSGMNYAFFCPKHLKRPPYYTNTRVYSCILIDNSIPHRWKGRYNEDTELSISVLKDGNCTFLFNAFLCGKQATHSMAGGNTEEVYNVNSEQFDNRKEFALSLYNQHPDVVKLTKKWGRWHHNVDYSIFVQQPIKKKGLNIPQGKVNEYGMVMRDITPDEKAIEEKYWKR